MPKVNKKLVNDSEPDFKIAVSIEDLERIDPLIRAKMFVKRLDFNNPVRANNELALAFTCRLVDAGMICDVLRSEDRKSGDSPTRVYLRNGDDDWRLVSNSTVFTVLIEGRAYLNPTLFDVVIKQEPPRPKAVTFGD